MSKSEEAVKTASIKGYIVTEVGTVIGKNKKELSLYNYKNYFFFSIKLFNSKTKLVGVHRLQAFQKYGEKIFEKGVQVRHLNGISSDNSFNNIAIGNNSENQLDIPKEDRILRASNPKYNHEDILMDRNLGLTYRELMIKYNISSKGTMSFIIKDSLKSKS